MKVRELIQELLATCGSLDDEVIVHETGIVTNAIGGRTAGTKEPAVLLNHYPPRGDGSE
jgi:hypothetical protein